MRGKCHLYELRLDCGVKSFAYTHHIEESTLCKQESTIFYFFFHITWGPPFRDSPVECQISQYTLYIFRACAKTALPSASSTPSMEPTAGSSLNALPRTPPLANNAVAPRSAAPQRDPQKVI